MAGVNARFADALLRRQFQMLFYSNGLTADVNKLLDETEAHLRELLNSRVSDIAARGFDAGPATTARLRVLAEAIRAMREKGFQAAQQVWTDDLKKMVQQEAGFADRALSAIVPSGIVLDTVLPDGLLLAQATADAPILGSVMEDWISSMADSDVQRIMSAVQTGLVSGEDMRTITRRVFGTASNNGGDGILELTRRDAQNFTRTAVMSLSNQTRDAYFKANRDLFEEEQYVATLDSRTTPLCRSLDGNRYPVGKGPIPGRDTHWNCRSVRVAIVNGEVIGMRASEVGQVPAHTTYQEWLKNQASDFQDTVLGPTRAEKFRSGDLTLTSLVNSQTGKQWSLRELRAREPETWSE